MYSKKSQPRLAARGALPLLWLTASLLSVHLIAACSSMGERTGDSARQDTTSPRTLEADRRRYIQASIEIGCLTRRETSPSKVAAGTLQIYQRHGFQEVMSYLAMVETVGKEKTAQLAIAEGFKSCP